ncbi:NADH dehydrogenase [ubiquinone] 1 alpha subcomplex subunit 13-B-like isoform X1 [Prosopis cineraria]|uniref:NADH dehydrogenase [ubiquinone] 1 alpha subcomplex subunit 13-B-like isoform X1 n=1 Tax=Prosopis cineraria TaxID=364024 RepID=UPI00240F33FD|nr:NADH dehydrogenase [ubiquinone] 1 alpha subcomplex subunit 13-B-like isoform X1 [Prosopis cineraria]
MTETIIRKRINKASLKDGPPLVRFARRISSKDLSAMDIFLTAFGAFSWGMCKVAQGIKTRRSAFNCTFLALEEENYAAACYILPILQSGEDARFFTEW